MTYLLLNAVRAAHYRYLDTLARDLRRQRSLDKTSAECPARDDRLSQLLAQEEWDGLLASLPVAVHRVMGLRCDGYSTMDIAQSLCMSQRTIQRLTKLGLQALRHRF